MDYVREQVADPKLSAVRQRVRWWSAIALLRCLASSPAAAEQTLLNRSAVAAADDETDEVDAYAEPRVLDTDLDDTLEAEDVTVGADTGDTDTPDTTSRQAPARVGVCRGSTEGPAVRREAQAAHPAGQGTARRGLSPDRLLPLHPHRRLSRRTPAISPVEGQRPARSTPSPERSPRRNAKPASMPSAPTTAPAC